MFGEKAKQIKNNPNINIETQNKYNILCEIFQDVNILNEPPGYNNIINYNNIDNNQNIKN
jgi:hypothetical protein